MEVQKISALNPERGAMLKSALASDREALGRIVSGLTGSSGRGFEDVVGSSSALESVFGQVEQVAPTDATVLVLGETGTGKELIARAIHNISRRHGGPFVKLNCAALPFDLMESELFGHEKGAFTGAVAQKIGRFEMAHTGTVFLDEIGDIPLELQPKLLRVLQEQEFERLGGTRTHRVDVRLVAATHRDLPEMVGRNEFRSDLYYRVNVFPVVLPPLRERREDIAQLIWHFVEIFARRMGKVISHLPVETLDALTSYSWPGNVRELRNLIERAVILATGRVLPNPLTMSDKKRVTVTSAPSTLRDSERALILQALEATGWVVGGPDGAAARLALPRNTLVSKMRRLGISRPARQTLTPPQSPFRDSERALILETLQATDWVVAGSNGTAARLGLPRTTLISKMKRLGISRPARPNDLDRIAEEPEERASAAQPQAE